MTIARRRTATPRRRGTVIRRRPGMANILSKSIPGLAATAEVTG